MNTNTKKNAIQFGTLLPDGTLTNVRFIKHADIRKCPHFILVPKHYNKDGTCRCNDAAHSEMKEWGYVWNGQKWI